MSSAIKSKANPLPNAIALYFDGACGPKNPGSPIGFGYVAVPPAVGADGKPSGSDPGLNEEFFDGMPADPKNSNNKAEYRAVLAALSYLEGFLENEGELYPVVLFGDSRLVVGQLSGRFAIKSGHYAPDARRAKKIYDRLSEKMDISVRWIPRSENVRADELSKEGLAIFA